jgi:radical SAM protein (TIGR01212 family)
MKPVHHYREYMISRYGAPLFRIPVDTGRGCPHRDADGGGGCTFCPEHGARAVQTAKCETLEQQIDEAMQFSRRRYGAKRFMLYFQAFSATHDLDESTRELYLRLLERHTFDAVSVGTRPDCLGDDTLAFLSELRPRMDVWVELGIQTAHDATLQRIHRGHDWACSRRALERLHAAGIRVAAHVILGLPGEGAEQFNQTAEALAALPVDAMKLHNLHVIEGTQMAEDYRNAAFKVYDEYEYAEILMQVLRRILWERPVIRMTTDTPAEQLIAPRWHMAKGQFVQYVEQQMCCREWRQGDMCGNDLPAPAGEASAYELVLTQDGSATFWNSDYREHYHTPAGARLEAVEKYVEPSHLGARLDAADVNLLDICFGLGGNTLAAGAKAVQQQAHTLHVTALEMDRRVVGQAARDIVDDEARSPLPDREIRSRLYHEGAFAASRFSVRILWGDARFTLRGIPPASQDIVFLDAFSTQRNSECWTLDFFRMIRAAMKQDGVLLTYCAALPVRAGLIQAGFFVGETRPVGRHRGGTLASPDAMLITEPLSEKEWRAIQESPRGFPYRDPFLCWSNSEILRVRQQRVVRAKQRQTNM